MRIGLAGVLLVLDVQAAQQHLVEYQSPFDAAHADGAESVRIRSGFKDKQPERLCPWYPQEINFIFGTAILVPLLLSYP